jgi:hypothetical protein
MPSRSQENNGWAFLIAAPALSPSLAEKPAPSRAFLRKTLRVRCFQENNGWAFLIAAPALSPSLAEKPAGRS